MNASQSNTSVLIRCLAAALIATTCLGPRLSRAADDITARVILSRPDTVSGGNALVMVTAPASLEWTAQLNGGDVTSSFQRDENSGNPVALLTGLRDGKNVLTVRAKGKNRAKLELVNHPVTGPIFSGPHQSPFICQTEAHGLGAPLDANCSAKTKVQYYYKSTETAAPLSLQAEFGAAPGSYSPGFKAYDPAGARPTDVAQIRTADGRSV